MASQGRFLQHQRLELLLPVFVFITINNPDFCRPQLAEHVSMRHVERIGDAVPLEAGKPEHLPERVGLQLTRLQKITCIKKCHKSFPPGLALDQLYRVIAQAQFGKPTHKNYIHAVR